jgi:hypothetical protein
MTGSVTVTGSLAVVTNGTEFQVNASGVKIGNIIGDTHTVTGSLLVSGSVGIGTTPSAWVSPFTAIQGGTYGQHVAFQSNAADIKIGSNNYYNGANYLYYTSSQGAAQFNVGSANGFIFNIAPTGTTGATVNFTSSMVITNAGNVGIGTINPTSSLHVYTTTASDNNGIIQYENGNAGTGATTNAQLIGKSKYGTVQFLVWENYGIRLGMRSTANSGAGSVYFTYGADTVAMTITGSGNVGIGTTTPRVKLDVAGSVFLSSGSQIQITGNSGATGLQLIGQDADVSIVGTMSAQSLVIRTDSLERMRIFPSGNVGIGIASDISSYKVQIQGVLRVESGYSGGGAGTFSIDYPGIVDGRLLLNSTGALTIRGALTQNASDERLKNNIQIIPNAISKISSLKGVTFDWNTEIFNPGRT